MNQHVALRRYLIKLLLITLALVGLAEAFVNYFYVSYLLPVLNSFYQLDKALNQINLSGFLVTSLKGFFWWMIRNIFLFFPNFFSDSIRIYVKNQANKSIFLQLQRMHTSFSPLEARLYIVSLLCILLLLLCLYILPFVIAAVVFSILVSKQVKTLEQNSLDKQHAFEKQRYLLLSDMAHDLKTPITTISGYAEALRQGEVPPEHVEEYLTAISQKSMQMSHIITLLFEYVRLDSTGFTLNQTTENFSELVRGCIASLYTDFEEKNISLQILIPENDIYAYVDRLHTERAINNILINAIRHNPSGTHVTVLLKLHNKKIVLRIYDNGVMIPAHMIQTIFDPFVQGDSSRTSKSGTGLGLSISKKVIEMHKGSLTLFQPEKTDSTQYTKVFEIALPNPSYQY